MVDLHREMHGLIQVYAMCVHAAYSVSVGPERRGQFEGLALAASLLEQVLFRIPEIFLQEMNVLPRVFPMVLVVRWLIFPLLFGPLLGAL